MVGNAIFAMLQ